MRRLCPQSKGPRAGQRRLERLSQAHYRPRAARQAGFEPRPLVHHRTALRPIPRALLGTWLRQVAHHPLSACSWRAGSNAPRRPHRRPIEGGQARRPSDRAEVPIDRGQDGPGGADGRRSTPSIRWLGLRGGARSMFARGSPSIRVWRSGGRSASDLGSSLFGASPKSGASRSSSPAIPTRVKRA